MRLFQAKTQESGLSLIELMISIVLGLLIVTAVIQLFLSNKNTYRITESQTQMQDNARFALNYLSKEIRSAGYSGCRAIEETDVEIIANAPLPTIMDEDTIMTGTESWGEGVVSATLGPVKTGSDVFTTQRAVGCGATLVSNLATSDANIDVASPNRCNLIPGEVLMIADCETAHIFRVTSVTANGAGDIETIVHADDVNQASRFCKGYSTLPLTGNCDDKKNKLYNYDAELYEFTSSSYFIRDDDIGLPALWVFDNTSATTLPNVANPNPRVMISGIDDMQIEYGLDDNDDDTIDRYDNAQAITNANEWEKVMSTEVSLLVQTQETNLTLNDQVLNYNGADVIGNDGRLRRVFTTIIGVRNRVQ